MDMVQYMVCEVCLQVYMVYWYELFIGLNVVYVEDFECGVVDMNIVMKDGQFLYLFGMLKVVGCE